MVINDNDAHLHKSLEKIDELKDQNDWDDHFIDFVEMNFYKVYNSACEYADHKMYGEEKIDESKKND